MTKMYRIHIKKIAKLYWEILMSSINGKTSYFCVGKSNTTSIPILTLNYTTSLTLAQIKSKRKMFKLDKTIL